MTAAGLARRPEDATGPAAIRVWMRADGVLPADPLVQVCALAYASDFTLLDSVLITHGVAWFLDDVKGASLDHAMWVRSEERRVGKECRALCRSRWSPYH